jgi:hypothetical protein
MKTTLAILALASGLDPPPSQRRRPRSNAIAPEKASAIVPGQSSAEGEKENGPDARGRPFGGKRPGHKPLATRVFEPDGAPPQAKTKVRGKLLILLLSIVMWKYRVKAARCVVQPKRGAGRDRDPAVTEGAARKRHPFRGLSHSPTRRNNDRSHHPRRRLVFVIFHVRHHYRYLVVRRIYLSERGEVIS